MKLPQDARFRSELRRFDLRFNCESCVVFDPEAERCVHEYPTGEHRMAHYRDVRVRLVFCKDFEQL